MGRCLWALLGRAYNFSASPVRARLARAGPLGLSVASMPRARVVPESATIANPSRLLHAGEVARLAGVHKTTVLQAVRRGELRASRTVGRSVRIALPDAAAYLLTRGISVTVANAQPAEPRVLVLLTEHPEVHAAFGELLPGTWRLCPFRGLYDDLLTVAVHGPAAIVVDLDVLGLNPVAILRSLRVHASLSRAAIFALSQDDAALEGALAHGADAALRAADAPGWLVALGGVA
jgi:excisionase family DNA binding protein